MEIKYPHITVQLTGENGNAFSLIGIVAKALREQEGTAAANLFADEAMEQTSYDGLLAYIQRTVNAI